MHNWIRRARDERGATLVEYALGASLFVLILVGSVTALQGSAGDRYSGNVDITYDSNAGDAGSGGVGSHLADLQGFATRTGNSWTATVSLVVRDVDGNLVEGAVVTGSWSPDTGSGDSGCTTSSSGACTIARSGMERRSNRPSYVAHMTWTISAISGAGVTYDAGSNVASSVTINAP